MKKGMIGLYAIICAGMLLFTGCAGTEVKMETENTVQSDSEDETAADGGKKTRNKIPLLMGMT